MSSRNSPFTIVARLFGLSFGVFFTFSLLFNWAAGRYILPFHVVLIVSVVLTGLYVVIGWAFVTGGANLLMGNDPDYQKMRSQGWHPFWDESAVSDWNDQAARGSAEPSNSVELADDQ